jgi:hypothetical protein
MPTTLNPTCPLCGLRYSDRPLLELHLREDHRQRDHRQRDHLQRDHRAEPGLIPPPREASATQGEAPATPGGAATAPGGAPRPNWARTAPHQVIWALRYANQELMRAFAALARVRQVSDHGGDRVAGGGRA